jgi:coproporphyrinogen III oxidase
MIHDTLPYGAAAHQAQARQWFETLRDRICAAFEALEGNGATFTYKPWQRPPENGQDAGGGTMGLMTGTVFEKVGVNVSTVHGTLSEGFRAKIDGAGQDGKFWASGISLVAHMGNPRVPSVHMNTRMLVTSGAAWFGGGADLTPTIEYADDTQDFHRAFAECCDRHDPAYYPKFKGWCDEYFFIKHRNEARGIGGIFYDNLNTGDWQKDFAFTKDVGETFLTIFPALVARRMHETATPEDRQRQLIKRGRYAEFNLVYDRGTQFGLQTGGNIEAILMSLPPLAAWPAP